MHGDGGIGCSGTDEFLAPLGQVGAAGGGPCRAGAVMPPPATGADALVRVHEGSTSFAADRDRLRYWQAYTTSALVGLRCSSYADDGLHAHQRNFDLGALRIAEISGNEHVVERTLPIVRRHPKDALFACLLLEGEAFFYQAGRCTPVRRGDLILYGTATPYLHGFTRPMRQLMIDVEVDALFEPASGGMPSTALRIDGSLQAGRLLTRPLQDRLLGFIENPLRAAAPAVAEQLLAGLRTLLRPRLRAASRHGDIAAFHLLRAERFIADHLTDGELDAEAVARHLSMSPRNLARVFEQHACGVMQWIWRERLALAHRLLADHAHASSPIGDIALGCGFSTQAHFAREFRQRYGLTPTQHRESATGARAGAAAAGPGGACPRENSNSSEAGQRSPGARPRVP